MFENYNKDLETISRLTHSINMIPIVSRAWDRISPKTMGNCCVRIAGLKSKTMDEWLRK